LTTPVDTQKTSTAKTRVRDAEATKARILDSAKKEFARNGLGGARVDVIAERAKANKRMIHHYFSTKEVLFQTVLEKACIAIRTAEQKLQLDHLEPKEALEKLVRFTWDYYLKNSEFLTLVNSENLHRASHLKNSEVVKACSRRFVAMVEGTCRAASPLACSVPASTPCNLTSRLRRQGVATLPTALTGRSFSNVT